MQRPCAKSGSQKAFRRNTAEHVYMIEAAHNPEVAGSNPAPATAKGAGNGAFRLLSEQAANSVSRPMPQTRSMGELRARVFGLMAQDADRPVRAASWLGGVR